MKAYKRYYLMGLALALVLSACGDDQVEGSNEQPAEQENFAPPLSPVDELLDGAPGNDSLRAEGKADAVYPPTFDLMATQSPVRDQASRGVCSIFSAVGLMEHLYIKEGTYLTPDFSEQYLQWSAKVEVGSFPTSEGSSAMYNLQAVTDYGIVEEDVWPYEPRPWGTAQDEECEGSARPVRCYTNGEPPKEAREAEKFKLKSSRYISTRTEDIKAYMTQHEQAVVVGFDFFYQSWNHGGSSLPTNSNYSANGYVLYPNSTDKTESLKERAGHSILLVGWDDTLEVQRVDENGEMMVDEDGEPVVEKGFYIFKNSWGTGSFGRLNPHGDGYGFISQRYIQEYGSARVAEMPELEPRVEICGDGIDNTGNGLTDCEDPVCAEHPTCQPESNVRTYTNDEALDIPDNDSEGVQSTLQVEDEGSIASLVLSLDITHDFQGDLSIILVHPNGDDMYIVADSSDPAGSFAEMKIVIDEFDGLDAQGEWLLDITDDHKYDAGTLNGWSLEITYED